MDEAFSMSDFQFVHIGEIRFRVFVAGAGQPLLLLHGFPDDITVWRRMVPGLVQAGYQVFAFDQRGCGETNAPSGVEHYTIRRIVDDILPVLNALGVRQSLRVIGHDWGAPIAWALAFTYPERVKAMVVVSVGHLRSYGRAGFEQKFVRGFYTLWFQLRGIAEWYLLRQGGQGMRRWMRNHPEAGHAIANMSRPGRLSAALNWYRANLLDILFRAWPRCKVPTLGVWSEHDPFLTEAQMRNSGTLMDAPWDYQRIEDCGHWIPLDAPERLNQLAISWFKQHG